MSEQIPPFAHHAFSYVRIQYLECIPRMGTLSGSWARHWRRASSFLTHAQNELTIRWGYTVAEKTQNEQFKISQWINRRLTDEDKQAIRDRGIDWPALFDWLEARMYRGYRFSIAYDDYSKAGQVSIVCRDLDDPNYGLAMSSRHPDLSVAFHSLQYKDEVLLADGWLGGDSPALSDQWD